MKTPQRVLLSIATILSISMATVPFAGADTVPTVPDSKITSGGKKFSEQDLRDAYNELLALNLPHRNDTISEKPVIIFALPTGGQLIIPDINAPQPRVSGGGSSVKSFWFEFTPTEQDLIISGGGFALGTAICLIPTVGATACAMSEAIITGAGQAISSHGKCDSRLRIEFSWTGEVLSTKCA